MKREAKKLHFKARHATQKLEADKVLTALGNVARSAESVAKCLSCLKASCSGIIKASRTEMITQSAEKLAQFGTPGGVISASGIINNSAGVKEQLTEYNRQFKERLNELRHTYQPPTVSLSLAPNGNVLKW